MGMVIDLLLTRCALIENTAKILLAGRQEVPGEKPETQHLHKTRESRLPLIIYDILRNGETPGRRQEKKHAPQDASDSHLGLIQSSLISR